MVDVGALTPYLMEKLDLVVAMVYGSGGGGMDAVGAQDVVEVGAITSVLKHWVQVKVALVEDGMPAAEALWMPRRAGLGGAAAGEHKGGR